MDSDIKFVHREETFNDHAVEELADARAMCICRLQFGRCEENECASCSQHKNYVMCRKQMNSYDRLRLDSKVSLLYGQYSRYPESFMSYKRLKNYYLKIVLLMLVLLVVSGAFSMLLGAETYKDVFTKADERIAPAPLLPSKHEDVSKETEINVRRLIRLVSENIYDVSGDGRINCQDYAMLFKLEWDKRWDKKDCKIIGNTNPRTSMCHLFVSVFDYKLLKYIDVEPWTDNLNKWQMADAWGKLYDIYFNEYDLEEYYLNKVRIR